jgi:predicted RNA-binding Zn-ribbon protein involved in translation (DUF1610 family)
MADEFKGQRKQMMSEGFRQVYGLSMGAKVEKPVCSECGSPMEKVEEVRGLNQDVIHTDQPAPFPLKVGETVELGLDFTRFSASLVPAPRCTECGEEMVPASATEWLCPSLECKAHGQPRCMGVYPAKMVP